MTVEQSDRPGRPTVVGFSSAVPNLDDPRRIAGTASTLSVREQTKDLAFGLYTRLKDVDDKTAQFVESFANFIQALGQSLAAEDLAAQQARLQDVARDLLSALPDLAHALDAVNPQLEVYQYELVQKIEWYQASRARVLSELEEAVANLNALDARTLAQIQTQALENQRRIHDATSELRSFLAREFSFKDSF